MARACLQCTPGYVTYHIDSGTTSCMIQTTQPGNFRSGLVDDDNTLNTEGIITGF